jgi:hypothetical protein
MAREWGRAWVGDWTDGGIFEILIPVILVGIHCCSSGSRRHLVTIRNYSFLGCYLWRRRRPSSASTSSRPLMSRAAFRVRIPVFRERRAGR